MRKEREEFGEKKRLFLFQDSKSNGAPASNVHQDKTCLRNSSERRFQRDSKNKQVRASEAGMQRGNDIQTKGDGFNLVR